MRLIDADLLEKAGLMLMKLSDKQDKLLTKFEWKDVPTAYDVEKIEQQIKDYFLETLNDCEEEYIPNAILKHNKAICKIIRKGGVE